MRFVVTRELNAPRAAVFDVISDPRRRLEWQSSLREVHVARDEPPRLGTSWYELTRGGLRFDMEITVFERPLRWAERGRGRVADARLEVQFLDVERLAQPEAAVARTLVVVEVQVKLRRGLALGAPLLRLLMPPALRADLSRVEALAGIVPPAA